MPDFLDQLGFLVTKILGGDSHSLIPLIKDKKSLSPHICQIHTRVDDHRDAAHVRQRYL